MPERLSASERGWRWLALASYVVFAVLAVGKPLFQSHVVTGIGVDLPGTLWMHWWVRTTVESGTLPISTDLLFYPDGKNFFNDTGANFIDAYLAVPLQWIFGVPDFLDVLAAAVLLGNALAMHALAGDLSGRRLAPTWAAAVAFQLNPYCLDQLAEGRPTQAMLWFAILATRHALRLESGTWRDAALFGLFTVLQGLTYWFMVYFLALALLPLVLRSFVRAPRVVGPRVAVAVAVAVTIAAPFLLKIHGEIAAGNVQRMSYPRWDVSPAAMPERWQIVHAELASGTWIAVLGLALASIRRTWPWLLAIGLTIAFAVGARVGVRDSAFTNPIYVLLWGNIPLLPRLGFPERILSMTFVLLAMCAAAGLLRLDAVWSPLLVAVVGLELLWRSALPLPTSVYDFSVGNQHIRREGGAVIYLPFGANEDAMVYQTLHGQPLFGGMGEREPDLRPAGYQERLRNTFIILLAGSLNDTEAAIGYTLRDREAISRLFRWVWFDRRFAPPSWVALGYDRASKRARLIKELGEPILEDASYTLWDLHAPVPSDAPGLAADAELAAFQLQRLENATRVPSLQSGPQLAPSP